MFRLAPSVPSIRVSRTALALIILNEIRGAIVAGPALAAIMHHWFR